MNINKEKLCLCALNRIFGFEPKIAHALISHLGSATDVFELGEKDLYYILGPHSRFKDQIVHYDLDKEGSELEAMSRKGIRFTGWTEEGYPELLKECDDAPVGLYIRSSTPDKELWGQHRALSIVGTRDLSPYGREWCCRIIKALGSSKEKPVIISGLAIGTDICAHRSAIDAGLPTIAVMATGPEKIYPLRHTDFAEQICSTPGCALITDYAPGTPPLAVHFLRRNRIIAGLGEATLLIESKIKGGGMMTADLAFSYGREVYAIPGRIDDICSQGCNRLIKAKVAEAVTDEADFLKSLRITAGESRKRLSDKETIHILYGSSLSRDRLELLTATLLAIRKNRGITVEELSYTIGIDYAQASQLTCLLESDGLIKIDLLQRCCINAEK